MVQHHRAAHLDPGQHQTADRGDIDQRKGVEQHIARLHAGAQTTTLALSSQWLWSRGTPLGRASVPEVQQMVSTSPPATGCAAHQGATLAGSAVAASAFKSVPCSAVPMVSSIMPGRTAINPAAIAA